MLRFGQVGFQAPFRLLCGIAFAACVILPLLSSVQNATPATSVQSQEFKTCKELPGANDVLVVFKTGATEFGHKFPVHLNTTLGCYPNYMLFSDHHEVYEGQTIHDALEPLNDHMKLHHRFEFGLYNRIKEGGRQILNADELSDRMDAIRHKDPKKSYLSTGWRLDKWKFLPMYETAYALSSPTRHEIRTTLISKGGHSYETHPDFKWYIFVEADTYVFWSSLLQYIATLDHRVASWSGADMFVAGTIIAHAGAGILVSNPGMKLFSEEYKHRREKWIVIMDDHRAGDVHLARVMITAGMLLTKSRPMFNPEAPGNDTYSLTTMDSMQWCDPVITYHHVSPDVVRGLWDSEPDLYASYSADFSGANSGQQVPKRRDIFIQYIYPQMLQGPKDLWDNNCQQDLGERSSFEACRQSCEEQLDCLQYRYDFSTKQCFVHDVAQLGDAAPTSNWKSGWITDRVHAFIEQAPTCEHKGWARVSSSG